MNWSLKGFSLLAIAAICFAAPSFTISVNPVPLIPGETASVSVRAYTGSPPQGEFAGQALKFVRDGESWVAFLGVHALTKPGKYTLRICLPSGACQEKKLVVASKPYPLERLYLTPEKTALLKPEIVKEESEIVAKAYSTFSAKPLWFFPFSPPLKGEIVVSSPFGLRRAYGNSPPSGFHDGVDFKAKEGTPVYAPAPGKVILARELTLRGKMVILDHGAGVMSGFLHLSEITVKEGQEVKRGELIGKVGNTGLSTAPHLHWEVRVNGIAVNPLTWLENSFRSGKPLPFLKNPRAWLLIAP